MSLKNIVKGTSNRALKEVGALGKELVSMGEERMEICKKCPIFDSVNSKCDASKGGCGCYMKSKVLAKEASCPKDKW